MAAWSSIKPIYIPLRNTLLSMIIKNPYQQPTVLGAVTKDNSCLRALNLMRKTKRGEKHSVRMEQLREKRQEYERI